MHVVVCFLISHRVSVVGLRSSTVMSTGCVVHWGEIEPFSATLAQDVLAECESLKSYFPLETNVMSCKRKTKRKFKLKEIKQVSTFHKHFSITRNDLDWSLSSLSHLSLLIHFSLSCVMTSLMLALTYGHRLKLCSWNPIGNALKCMYHFDARLPAYIYPRFKKYVEDPCTPAKIPIYV